MCALNFFFLVFLIKKLMNDRQFWIIAKRIMKQFIAKIHFQSVVLKKKVAVLQKKATANDRK